MMRSTLNLNCIDASTDVFGDAASIPWVKISIGEDDIGILSVFLSVVLPSSERSHGPIIIWSQIVFGSAFSSISSLIEKIILIDKN